MYLQKQSPRPYIINLRNNTHRYVNAITIFLSGTLQYLIRNYFLYLLEHYIRLKSNTMEI